MQARSSQAAPAEYVVTATGNKTEIGKIAKLVAHTELPETPLAARMKQLGMLLGGVVVALCLLIVGIGMSKDQPWMEMVLIGVSLAVSAVPEGLPAVVTVCLAMGVRRMVKKNALVRRLEATRDTRQRHRHLRRQDRDYYTEQDGSRRELDCEDEGHRGHRGDRRSPGAYCFVL